ncbi:hypothetical protein VIGAN_05238800, partial [Vigna angularis var. angularis]
MMWQKIVLTCHCWVDAIRCFVPFLFVSCERLARETTLFFPFPNSSGLALQRGEAPVCFPYCWFLSTNHIHKFFSQFLLSAIYLEQANPNQFRSSCLCA